MIQKLATFCVGCTPRTVPLFSAFVSVSHGLLPLLIFLKLEAATREGESHMKRFGMLFGNYPDPRSFLNVEDYLENQVGSEFLF